MFRKYLKPGLFLSSAATITYQHHKKPFFISRVAHADDDDKKKEKSNDEWFEMMSRPDTSVPRDLVADIVSKEFHPFTKE